MNLRKRINFSAKKKLVYYFTILNYTSLQVDQNLFQTIKLIVRKNYTICSIFDENVFARTFSVQSRSHFLRKKK